MFEFHLFFVRSLLLQNISASDKAFAGCKISSKNAKQFVTVTLSFLIVYCNLPIFA